MVPRMIQIMTTKNRKTAILALLARNAMINRFEAPTYLVSFKILKTRNKRNARNAARLCDPTITKLRYLGNVERRSMMP